MRYMGGKHRQSKAITAELVRRYAGQKTYAEPFCGALGQASRAVPELARLGVKRFMLSDVSLALMNTWKALIYGRWEPPDFVSEDEYKRIKSKRDPENPLTAYCGFALSFGGKWFGVYARDRKHERNFNVTSKRSTLRKASLLRPFKPTLKKAMYSELSVEKAIVYLDPPYRNSTKYHDYEGKFDYEAFTEWAESLGQSNDVILTEFVPPSPLWRVVHEWGNTKSRHINAKPKDSMTNERIFEFVGNGKSSNHQIQLSLFRPPASPPSS